MDLDSLINLAATNGASDLHLEAGLSAEEALANASVKEAGLLRVPAIQ